VSFLSEGNAARVSSKPPTRRPAEQQFCISEMPKGSSMTHPNSCTVSFANGNSPASCRILSIAPRILGRAPFAPKGEQNMFRACQDVHASPVGYPKSFIASATWLLNRVVLPKDPPPPQFRTNVSLPAVSTVKAELEVHI
jgi:hypothetical protein